jgi:hypothetical protein
LNYDDWVLVIPSIRSINPEYIKTIPKEFKIIVVDDSHGSIRPNRNNMMVFNYNDQRKIMGENYDLIPHKTAACRNFGFYYVWKETDIKFVVSIDDDCVLPPDFIHCYGTMLGNKHTLPTLSVEGGKWFNTIDMLQLQHKIYARGFPRWERGPSKYHIHRTTGKVTSNMGLWSGFLDVDGIDRFLLPEYEQNFENVELRAPYYRVGTASEPVHFSLCSMNFGFIREVLPILSQVPMGDMIDDGYFIWRYDDIWAGYIAQALIHLKDDAITIGRPLVKHKKIGDVKKEMLGEHFGQLISPYFYEIIDLSIGNVYKNSYAVMYNTLLQSALQVLSKTSQQNKIPPPYYKYLKSLFARMHRWSKLFCEET